MEEFADVLLVDHHAQVDRIVFGQGHVDPGDDGREGRAVALQVATGIMHGRGPVEGDLDLADPSLSQGLAVFRQMKAIGDDRHREISLRGLLEEPLDIGALNGAGKERFPAEQGEIFRPPRESPVDIIEEEGVHAGVGQVGSHRVVFVLEAIRTGEIARIPGDEENLHLFPFAGVEEIEIPFPEKGLLFQGIHPIAPLLETPGSAGVPPARRGAAFSAVRMSASPLKEVHEEVFLAIPDLREEIVLRPLAFHQMPPFGPRGASALAAAGFFGFSPWTVKLETWIFPLS